MNAIYGTFAPLCVLMAIVRFLSSDQSRAHAVGQILEAVIIAIVFGIPFFLEFRAAKNPNQSRMRYAVRSNIDNVVFAWIDHRLNCVLYLLDYCFKSSVLGDTHGIKSLGVLPQDRVYCFRICS